MLHRAGFGAVSDVAASRHSVFTRQQAAELGLHRNVLARLKARGHVVEPVPGVLVINGSVDTWRQRIMIATSASNCVGVACYSTAAALHRLDGFRPGLIEILAPNYRSTIASCSTLRIGRVDESEVVLFGAIRATAIPRTLCDIARIESRGRVRAAFESAWRNGTTLDEIRETVVRLHGRGRRGTSMMLQLLADAEQHGVPTDSALEVKLENCLAGAVPLVRQYVIRDEVGVAVARPDFAVVAAKVAIEAHSRRFHWNPSAQNSDTEREHRMQRLGWMTMYVGSEQLKRPEKVRSDVSAVVAQRLHALVS